MTSIDIPASQQALVASAPLISTPCVKRRRLCFENVEPGRKRVKASSETLQKSGAVVKKEENCLKTPALVPTAEPRPRSLSPAAKDNKKASSCAAENQLAKQSSKLSSRNSPNKLSDVPCESVPGTKKKLRSALQTIHIKALEHGLRIPVNSTPLGTLDKSENIIYGSLSGPLERPVSARPAVAIGTCHARDTTALPRRPLTSYSAAGVRGSQSAPASPARPRKLGRRNASESTHSEFVLEI